MSGSFTSRTYNITALLGRASFPDYSAKQIVVPEFQRPFSWGKSHVAAFWDDIIRFHKQINVKDAQETYFLGPIVIMPEKESIKLLDGQQRLATATILLGILRDTARPIGQSGSDLARDIQRDYIFLDEDEGTYALTLGELDDPYFRATIQNEPREIVPAKYDSHQLIKVANSFLTSKVKDYISELTGKEAVQSLRGLLKTLTNHLRLVAIQVNSEEEAFLIFETLNDRGLRLAVPDLLLNHLMRTAPNPKQRKIVRQSWNSIIENLGTSKTSTFIRHMWVSQYGDVKSQSLFREIRDKIGKEGIDSVAFASKCAAESALYKALLTIDRSILKESSDFIEPLIKNLSADQTLPLLLAGRLMDDSEFVKLARLILNVWTRHTVLANQNPLDLEDVLYSAARAVREAIEEGKGSIGAFVAAKTLLNNMNPSSELIRSALSDLTLTKYEANYIVYKIADHLQSSNKSVSVKSNSIEHIFPENAETDEWPDADRLRPLVWHIGNLSVLEPTFNRDAGNKSYEDKKLYFAKSSVEETRVIPEHYQTWGVNEIKKRALSFAKIIEHIWPERS